MILNLKSAAILNYDNAAIHYGVTFKHDLYNYAYDATLAVNPVVRTIMRISYPLVACAAGIIDIAAKIGALAETIFKGIGNIFSSEGDFFLGLKMLTFGVVKRSFELAISPFWIPAYIFKAITHSAEDFFDAQGSIHEDKRQALNFELMDKLK